MGPLALLLLNQLLHGELQIPAEAAAPLEPEPAAAAAAQRLQRLERCSEQECCVCLEEYQICQPCNLSAWAKESVTLPCTFWHSWQGAPEKIRVSWRFADFHGPFFFNTTQNYIHSNFSGRVSLAGDPSQGNASIQIGDLKTSDPQQYFCRISVQLAEGQKEFQCIQGTRLTIQEERRPPATEAPPQLPPSGSLLGALAGAILTAAAAVLGLLIFLTWRKGCGPKCPRMRRVVRRGEEQEEEEAAADGGSQLGLPDAGAGAAPPRPPSCPPPTSGEPGLLYATLAFSGAPGAKKRPLEMPRTEEVTYAGIARH
ncbi:paired immunoglobulin-like type 2 receptor beta isoform X2 [Hemicordylus capensis]|uniref:paired immunoglobulin-like type 2 receptor beta isoform X2 n=1 Tax=Hemicordylus capensis TaxID=884348 RepID=UPI0023043C11|nr:paired immunoglobulin-like type 2 receptor beta isoform X2 [Hemicordylus capensis]